MRIRKDKKLAQLGLSSDAVHVCQLNQSPWDVPSATTSTHHHYNSSSSLRSPLFQVVRGHEDDVDTSLTGNGSLGDSLGAVDSSVASMDRDESMVVVGESEDGNGIGFGIGEKLRACCNKTNGKGWQCQKPVKRGQSMCRHHLDQLMSYRHNHDKAPKKKQPPVAGTSRRGRGRGGKKAAVPRGENPYTFYYYAGFGPTWGRKRSGGGANGPDIGAQNVAAQDPISFEEFDDDDDHNPVNEEADDSISGSGSESDSDSDGGGKRVRRPVKERSLKSLM